MIVLASIATVLAVLWTVVVVVFADGMPAVSGVRPHGDHLRRLDHRLASLDCGCCLIRTIALMSHLGGAGATNRSLTPRR